MKNPVNWKGGLRVLIFFATIYFGYIYFMFFNEPAGGWKGSLPDLRYPTAVIAPVLMVVVVFYTFRGK